MEYTQLQVPSFSRRIAKSLAFVAVTIGLGCAALYAYGQYQQQADPAVSMAFMPSTGQTASKFMQPRSFNPPMMGCPIAARNTITHADVKLGSDSGGLVFVPDSVTIKSGESVTFTNNAGFPHNIVFDEDNVPDGVAADSLSREDYLNAPGETYSVKFDKAGTYGYYCEPHRGAGMQGKIVVQ